jgi:predicted amidohydrolase
MRTAVLQLGYGDDEPIQTRRDRVADLVRAERGSDLVVLPELWPQRGFAYTEWADLAEPQDGPTVKLLAEVAAETGSRVLAGSHIERDPAGRLFNTAVLLGSDGSVVARYRKIHLFGFGEGEPKLLTPGEDLVTCGPFGLATCYDLRFPEMFRRLLDAGTEVALIPSAWPAKRVAHWRLLAQARAVENQMYVVACNTAGTHAGVPMGGHSMVVDPWGTVLAEAGEDEEVLRVDLDLGFVSETRDRFPVLADRRL